jgi:hypothetical protein
MDEQSQAKLDEILKKEQAALTEGDKDFLRAREAYLSDSQKATYSEVFKASDEPVKKKADK